MSAQAVPGIQQGNPAGPAASGRWRTWAWIGGYAVAAVALFFCYLRLSGTQKVTSDGASMALQAWDMLHGNLLLHGWTVADVTFWTTELPEYALIELVRGLGAFDVHTAAAVTYTLLVLLAGVVAKGRATGREGLVRVLVASGIMVAPQLGQGTLILLLAPDHTGTGVPLLLIWLVLDRGGRRWWVPPAVGLMLTWTLVGDRVAEVLAVAPLVLVFGYRAVRGLLKREPGYRFDAAMAVAAAASYVVSVLIGKLVVALGGFRLLPVKLGPATSLQVVGGNIVKTADGVLALFGAEFYRAAPGLAMVVSLVHMVGLLLAVTAVAVGAWRLVRSEDPLVSVLTVGVLVNLAVYVFSRMPVTIWSTREIAGVLPAGAVLAGRLLAGPLARAWTKTRAGLWIRPLAAVIAVAYLAALGYGMAQRQLPAEGQNLADWLTARHLTNGLSGYGYGPTTTLASGGKVELRQAEFSYRTVSPGPEEQQQSWYDPHQHRATFLVLSSDPGPFADLTPAQARRIFGRPAHVYRVGREFRVWTYDSNLLSRVR